MGSRNTILSVIQKEGKRGSALKSALASSFDNENESASKTVKKGEQQKKK